MFSDLVFGCWLLVILDSVGYLETAVTIYRHLKFLGDSDGSGNGCDSGDKKVKGWFFSAVFFHILLNLSTTDLK